MTDRPAPGTPLVFRWRKWDGAPHWEHECMYLGSDVHGDWVGQRDGWRRARPGYDLRSEGDNVTLIPPRGEFAASLNATHPLIAIYIDVAWDLRWDAAADPAGIPSPTGIDMDLDVVRARDGRGTWIDDRDEWEEHRVQYGYPREIVERLETVAVELEAEVRAERAPYDQATAAHWLAVLAALPHR
ncbi:hypothetical protein [Microbacterium hominis]|uniref:DUF402 domain-containing protein n=1 Tax=Microbacterium hominis TaxID=162426 RepID=A0A0B4CX09_9MICO|nr:hypothetical protein [Microbacterium hominis]KIC56605.1 hypothetical protein RM52_12350 [Microbacterium hominis]